MSGFGFGIVDSIANAIDGAADFFTDVSGSVFGGLGEIQDQASDFFGLGNLQTGQTQGSQPSYNTQSPVGSGDNAVTPQTDLLGEYKPLLIAGGVALLVAILLKK